MEKCLHNLPKAKTFSDIGIISISPSPEIVHSFLKPILRKFWSEVMDKLEEQKSVRFLLRFRLEDITNDNERTYRTITISKLQIINKNDLNPLLEVLVEYLVSR